MLAASPDNDMLKSDLYFPLRRVNFCINEPKLQQLNATGIVGINRNNPYKVYLVNQF